MEPRVGPSLTTDAKSGSIKTPATEHGSNQRKRREAPVKIRDKKVSNELIRRIHARQVYNGHELGDLAEYLGLSYSHASMVLGSPERLKNTSPAVLQRIASYLNASLAQVYVWSGILSIEDFFVENIELHVALERAWIEIVDDARNVLTLQPDQWRDLPLWGKLLIVTFYEKASGKTFLPKLGVLPPDNQPSEEDAE